MPDTILHKPGDRPVPGRQYALIKPIGKGSFGEVWSAHDAGVEVAIKFVRDLRRDFGGKELNALNTLRNAKHPNLVSLHGYWVLDKNGDEIRDISDLKLDETIQSHASMTVPDQLIYVMDLAQGSVRELLDAQEGGIEPKKLISFLRDSARAIDYLNANHGLQHRDIKPGNIFLSGGVAQVGDFSLVGIVDTLRTSSSRGTPGYSAPEVARGEIADTSDQCSLALTFCDMRTGRLPYEHLTAECVYHAKQNGTFWLEGIPEPEAEIVRRATALDPGARYGSCTEFVELLATVIGPDRVLESPCPTAPKSIGASLTAQTLNIETVRLGKSDTKRDGVAATNNTPRSIMRRAATLLAIGLFAGLVWQLVEWNRVHKNAERLAAKSEFREAMDEIDKSWLFSPFRNDESRRVKLSWASRLSGEIAVFREHQQFLKAIRAVKTAQEENVPVDVTSLRNEIGQEWRSFVVTLGENDRVEQERLLQREFPVNVETSEPKPSVPNDMPSLAVKLLLEGLSNKTSSLRSQLDDNPAHVSTEMAEYLDAIPADAGGAAYAEDKRTARLLLAWSFSRQTPAQWNEVSQQLNLLATSWDDVGYFGPGRQLHALLHVSGEIQRSQAAIRNDYFNAKPTLELVSQFRAIPSEQNKAWAPSEIDLQSVTRLISSVRESLANDLANFDRVVAVGQALVSVSSSDNEVHRIIVDAHITANKNRDALSYITSLGDTISGDLQNRKEILSQLLSVSPNFRRVDALLAANMPIGVFNVLRASRDQLEIDFKQNRQKFIRDQIIENAFAENVDHSALLELFEQLDEQQPPILAFIRKECEIKTDSPLSVQSLPVADAQFRDYCAYVSAIADHRDGAYQKTIERLQRVDPTAAGLNDARRKSAADALIESVAGLATELTSDSQIKQGPFAMVHPANLPLQAFDKYALLTGSVVNSAELSLLRAHAGWRAGETEIATTLTRKLVRDFSTTELSAQQTSLLYQLGQGVLKETVAAATLTGEDVVKIIAGYKRLVEISNSDDGESEPLNTYLEVIQPAEQLIAQSSSLLEAAELTENQKRLIASIFAEKAQLIKDHEFESWPFDDPFNVSLLSIEQAINLITISPKSDKQAAEYFLLRGEVARKLQLRSPVEIQADAEKAIQLDPELWMAKWLRGHCLLQLSKNEPNLTRLNLLRDAIDEFSVVAEKLTGIKKAIVLIDRCNARIEFANYARHELSAKEKLEILTAATTDAKSYLEIEKRNAKHRYDAFCSLGNAYEDLAYIAGSDLAANYRQAEETFRKAIAEDDIGAHAYKHLGRCLIKMHFNGIKSAVEPRMVEASLNFLNRAHRLYEAKSQHSADAHYWLARGLMLEDRVANASEADQHFASAFEIDPNIVDAVVQRAAIALARNDFDSHDELYAQAIANVQQIQKNQRDALAYTIHWLLGGQKEFGSVNSPEHFVKTIEKQKINELPKRLADAHLHYAQRKFASAAKHLRAVSQSNDLLPVDKSTIVTYQLFCEYLAEDNQTAANLKPLANRASQLEKTFQSTAKLRCLPLEILGEYNYAAGMENTKDSTKFWSLAATYFDSAIKNNSKSARRPRWVAKKYALWVHANAARKTITIAGKPFPPKSVMLDELKNAWKACTEENVKSYLKTLITRIQK